MASDPRQLDLHLGRQGLHARAFQAHVSADRSGIDTLMKNLAIEWGHHGIRVYSIVPGPIEGTEGMKRLADPSQEDRVVDAVRLRRMGTVDDIGQAVVFLASPASDFVNGHILYVDGGILAYIGKQPK